jgi:hypothetical protein
MASFLPGSTNSMWVTLRQLVLLLDVEAYAAHLARAHWMTHARYRELLK